jgi:amphiphysin
MKPMQRQFGKLMSKGPGDTAKVSVLLNDYEDADKMLTKVGVAISHVLLVSAELY